MRKTKHLLVLAFLIAITQTAAFAQSGVTGLNTATTTLKTYVGPVTNLTLVIGGIVGLVGGLRVYSKWNSGDFKKFSFPGHKVFKIELNEKQITGRMIEMRLKYKDLLDANAL